MCFKKLLCYYGCFFGSEDHWEEVDARRHALWWLWRPILDLQALEQDGHVNVVSVTGWLAESFCRCCFSAAAIFLLSSKLSAAVLIVPLRSSLSSASASHSLWSMPACVSCRFNWSLKHLGGHHGRACLDLAPRKRRPLAFWSFPVKNCILLPKDANDTFHMNADISNFTSFLNILRIQLIFTFCECREVEFNLVTPYFFAHSKSSACKDKIPRG